MYVLFAMQNVKCLLLILLLLNIHVIKQSYLPLYYACAINTRQTL